MGQTINCMECGFTQASTRETCHSCGIPLTDSNPYETPEARVSKVSGSDMSKFPMLCRVLPVLIILLEVCRLGIFTLALMGMEDAGDDELQNRVSQYVFSLFAIAALSTPLGFAGSILTLLKKRPGILVCKLYAAIIVVGICFFFVKGNMLLVIINVIIAVMILVNIIHFSSWWRQQVTLEKIAERKAKGQVRKRPAGRLKKKS